MLSKCKALAIIAQTLSIALIPGLYCFPSAPEPPAAFPYRLLVHIPDNAPDNGDGSSSYAIG